MIHHFSNMLGQLSKPHLFLVWTNLAKPLWMEPTFCFHWALLESQMIIWMSIRPLVSDNPIRLPVQLTSYSPTPCKLFKSFLLVDSTTTSFFSPAAYPTHLAPLHSTVVPGVPHPTKFLLWLPPFQPPFPYWNDRNVPPLSKDNPSTCTWICIPSQLSTDRTLWIILSFFLYRVNFNF